MTPNNQSVSGDAQNFWRPRQPIVHRPGPCWHGPNWPWPREIPDQHGRGTVGPNPPVQKSMRSHQWASGQPFSSATGRRTQPSKHRGHWAEHPIDDSSRHGPNWSWPRKIPDQRGRGTVGPNPPVQKSSDRTNGHLGNHLARPRVDARSRASIGGIGPSIPSPTARGMAQTAPGLGKSPTNEAVARSGPATAKSARAKVYAIAPMDLWATIKLGHGSAYAA